MRAAAGEPVARRPGARVASSVPEVRPAVKVAPPRPVASAAAGQSDWVADPPAGCPVWPALQVVALARAVRPAAAVALPRAAWPEQPVDVTVPAVRRAPASPAPPVAVAEPEAVAGRASPAPRVAEGAQELPVPPEQARLAQVLPVLAAVEPEGQAARPAVAWTRPAAEPRPIRPATRDLAARRPVEPRPVAARRAAR
jgi:hypothetical protein